MFMGEYTHSIDAKGRVILPADFRQELGVSFIITKGLDRSLFLFPQAAWDEFAAKLRTLSLVDPNARAFARFFIAGARTLECDKQGRFLVPANLRTYANIGLKQDVILTGADTGLGQGEVAKLCRRSRPQYHRDFNAAGRIWDFHLGKH